MDILNEFGIKPILLAAQVVNFLILLYILKRFLYKPILKVLNERKNKIADSLKNAEEIERKLVEISEEEQKRIAKAVSDYCFWFFLAGSGRRPPPRAVSVLPWS